MLLDGRQRELLRLIWCENRLSRWELHQLTGVNPNAIGNEAAALLQLGILREGAPESVGQGRPRVPLEIDVSSRDVIGLALSPGQIEIARLNLRGNLLGGTVTRSIEHVQDLVPAAQQLLRSTLRDQTLAIGISSPGFLDPEKRAILSSSITCVEQPLDFRGLNIGENAPPIVFENDMHALAVRWVLTHQAEQSQDVLLVYIGDGRLGAALLVDGRPNRGCLMGANELGHTRFFVETERCYCGHEGCLERICSTDFLNRQATNGAVSNGDLSNSDDRESRMVEAAANGAPIVGERLLDRVAHYSGNDPALEYMLKYLSCALSNTINFVRPNRLVLVSEFTRYAAFNDALLRQVRSGVLFDLVDRVRIDVWDQPSAVSAETAGWLALAGLYQEGWNLL
ncbi:MAG: ROK family protein [Planctomycetota bacterium]|nr:ROK family protein [Planctomycetota bacterium]